MMDTLLDPHEIARLLAEQGDWRDVHVPFKVTGPLKASGSFSRIFRGDGGMFPCPVAIKQFLDDPSSASPAESARTYFHGLRRMAEVTARRDLSAAEPYAILEAHGIVVTSWIEGPTLAQSLIAGSPDLAGALSREAGRWLAGLHYESSSVVYRPPDVSDMLAVLTQKGVEADALTRRAFYLLRSYAPLLTMQPVPWSRHYGDFKPANLIVRGGRLIGIDIELLFTTPTVWDAAHFLNHMQLAFYSPRVLPQWRQAPKLAELFCRGYSDAFGEPLPQRLLQWQRLYNALWHMTNHREWCRSLIAWPSRLAQRHLVTTLCNTLADTGRR